MSHAQCTWLDRILLPPLRSTPSLLHSFAREDSLRSATWRSVWPCCRTEPHSITGTKNRVAADTRKWIECDLTHHEDNFDETDAETCRVSLLLTTSSEDRTTMREDTKLARILETLGVSVTTLSNRSVSMTHVHVATSRGTSRWSLSSPHSRRPGNASPVKAITYAWNQRWLNTLAVGQVRMSAMPVFTWCSMGRVRAALQANSFTSESGS